MYHIWAVQCQIQSLAGKYIDDRKSPTVGSGFTELAASFGCSFRGVNQRHSLAAR
jgi:hypothetical protein